MASDLLQTALLAGRIMIEGGSEMYRVDDTMHRIADNGGAKHVRLFTTPTGLFISAENESASVESVHFRGIDMEKIAGVNQLSRAFEAKEIDLPTLKKELHRVDRHTPNFSLGWQIFGAAFCSAMLMIIFSGQYDWIDMPLSAVVGALGYIAYIALQRTVKVRFIGELFGGLTVAFTAWLGVRAGIGSSLDNLIIGGVMPLVPGVALTNSIRDLLAGHILSGMARGAEAILSAVAIGCGVAIIFRFF